MVSCIACTAGLLGEQTPERYRDEGAFTICHGLHNGNKEADAEKETKKPTEFIRARTVWRPKPQEE